jgi:hypothetical protein
MTHVTAWNLPMKCLGLAACVRGSQGAGKRFKSRQHCKWKCAPVPPSTSCPSTRHPVLGTEYFVAMLFESLAIPSMNTLIAP